MREESQTHSFSLSAYWHLVRSNRNFRLLWSAQIVSELGDWFYSIAVYSLLLELTGSAKAVAAAVVLQVLPQVAVAPLAGVLNDRLSRRKVMIFADLARVVVVLGMVFVRSANLVWLLYVILFFETCMWALFEPGRTAIIPNITRGLQERLVANALSSTTWSFNLAAGSALGGIVAVLLGRDSVFVLNALSFVASALLLYRMNIVETHVDGRGRLRWSDLVDFTPVVEGVRYVKRDMRLMATLFVKAGLGLLSTHWIILPVFGERVFPVTVQGMDPARSGMLGMSILMGSRGVGSLIGSFAGGVWAGQREVRLRTGICYGFLAVAAGYVALGFAPSLFPAVLTVILAHAGGSGIWVFSTTLLQAQTEDRFRGRVFSADFAIMFLIMSAANYLAGSFVDWGASVRSIALATGILGLVPAVLWLFALRLWRDSGDKVISHDGHA